MTYIAFSRPSVMASTMSVTTIPFSGGQGAIPGVLELGDRVVADDLVAGEGVGQATGVAAALHVVLAAQGRYAGPRGAQSGRPRAPG